MSWPRPAVASPSWSTSRPRRYGTARKALVPGRDRPAARRRHRRSGPRPPDDSVPDPPQSALRRGRRPRRHGCSTSSQPVHGRAQLHALDRPERNSDQRRQPSQHDPRLAAADHYLDASSSTGPGSTTGDTRLSVVSGSSGGFDRSGSATSHQACSTPTPSSVCSSIAIISSTTPWAESNGRRAAEERAAKLFVGPRAGRQDPPPQPCLPPGESTRRVWPRFQLSWLPEDLWTIGSLDDLAAEIVDSLEPPFEPRPPAR